MRTILFVQSLIILSGAYYIYTLSQDAAEVGQNQNTTVLSDITVSTTTTAESHDLTPDSSTPDIEENNTADAEVRIDMDGPTDAGMEFPTFDGELEVR